MSANAAINRRVHERISSSASARALIAVMENYVEARVLAINTDALNTGVAVSMGRISAQVVSGIGFLGAGTIFLAGRRLQG